MNKLLILTTALALQSCANYMPPLDDTDSEQVFNCREKYSDNYSVLVRATAIPAEGIGTIEVAGVKHPATYKVSGFDRDWRFGPMVDGGHIFAFIIKPDGMGYYFDFSLQKPNELHATSSDSFQCGVSY